MVTGALTTLDDLDYARVSASIESFIADQVKSAHCRGAVLGLSGGVDSAVVSVLAKNAFPKNTLVIIMPDSRVSPKEETQDALDLVDLLGLDYKILDIALVTNEFTKTLEPSQRGTGNLRARIRANILYYYANLRNYLVLGCSDKSEYLIGYFTKFGDGSADILPIVSLYKTQVRGLARHLQIPQRIIDKKSSPNLWVGHDAETEIGATYEEIDAILYNMTDCSGDTESLDIPQQKIEKIRDMHHNSRHKREPAIKMPDIK